MLTIKLLTHFLVVLTLLLLCKALYGFRGMPEKIPIGKKPIFDLLHMIIVILCDFY